MELLNVSLYVRIHPFILNYIFGKKCELTQSIIGWRINTKTLYFKSNREFCAECNFLPKALIIMNLYDDTSIAIM